MLSLQAEWLLPSNRQHTSQHIRFPSHIQVKICRLQEQMLQVWSICRGKVIMGWREIQYQRDSLLIKLHSEGHLKAVRLMFHYGTSWQYPLSQRNHKVILAKENLFSSMKFNSKKAEQPLSSIKQVSHCIRTHLVTLLTHNNNNNTQCCPSSTIQFVSFAPNRQITASSKWQYFP